MIKVAYLCAVMAAGIPCTPFTDMTACRAAEGGLSVALVERSECAPVEVIRPYHPAPETAPLPIPRPENLEA